MALASPDDSPHLSPVEKLALRYARALTESPVDVPDALFAELQRHFTNPQLVELTSAIAWENYRARVNRAFAVEPEDLSKGAFCPLPQK